ncbi:UvsY-like protein [Caulobacter phage Cr30]|uniref:UvsY-like protein n=1 Tax=Caulobacter phage Cr30 TaxID=1357714 RepID=UPI0004A9B462|nr:UvsY-like protein [Caulobacter phage Cr30]AGS81049.1 UvsY-like protein [Caulobacter phage Cr30]
MKLEEIQQKWNEDSEIDEHNLATESTKIPKLHSKYFAIFSRERLLLRKMEIDLKELSALRYEFYTASLDDETIEKMGWTQEWRDFGKKVLKGDVNRYLESDKYLNKKMLEIAYQKEKVLFCESIIDTIKYRSNTIRNAIDFLRFTNGS